MRARILGAVAGLLLLGLAVGGAPRQRPRTVLRVTYLDGREQTITLDQPAEQIAKWEFGSPDAPTPPPAEPMPAALRALAGRWIEDGNGENFGSMVLSVEGDHLAGTYTVQGGRITIRMAPNGRDMIGHWSEDPSHQPEDDAGEIKVTVNENGRRMTLDWTYGDGPGGGTTVMVREG